MSWRGDHGDGGGDDDGNDGEDDDDIDRDVKHFDQLTCFDIIPNIINACSG